MTTLPEPKPQASLLWRVPIEDQDEYLALPESVQNKIDQKLAILRKISKAKSVQDGCRYWAAHMNGKRGYSFERLQALFYEYRRTGDWRCVSDRAKNPKLSGRSIGLPAEFKDFIGGFFQANQRKCKAGYREFLRYWRTGYDDDGRPFHVPGYGTWQEWFQRVFPTEPLPSKCPPDLPEGWSYENIMRYAKPPEAELAVARIGISAGTSLLPPVPGTRQGVRPLEYIFFDDVWLDRKVIVPGYRQPVRLLQLGCLDYASGVYLRFGQRPELPNEDGKRERLKERDMKWLVATFLEQFGYPVDYVMHLICERGTATLREPDARALYDISEGRIKVCYTSMEGGLVLVWEERKSGNARGKGPLESWHNLFHNECASLPGQMGKDRDHCPAQLHGQERAAVALHDAGQFLTPELRAKLKLPFATKDEAYFQTLRIVERINHRTDHELEGFENVLEWRIAGTHTDWRPDYELAAMPENARTALINGAIEWNSRLETPMERLRRLSHGLQFRKIPSGILPRFYEDCHVLTKIENYAFSFKHEGKTYTYLPESPEQALPDGEEYLGYFRPSDMEVIHLTKKNGGFVATWKLEKGVKRGDSKAVAEAIRKKQSFLNQAIANVRRRQPQVMDQAARDLENNAAVLEEAGLIPGADTPATQDDTAQATPTAQALQQAVSARAGNVQRRQTYEERQRELLARAERVRRQSPAAEESSPSEDMADRAQAALRAQYADTNPENLQEK